jgi:hypothetical protein
MSVDNVPVIPSALIYFVLWQALEPNPKSLRVLYVYESKMALLMKLAGTREGAETVLAQGALSSLANLRALSAHPDIHTHPHAPDAARDTDFVPSVANRSAFNSFTQSILIYIHNTHALSPKE